MVRLACVFERFPSFGQTFCYREVAELERQGADLRLFSIRKPTGEPPQDWDASIVRRVHYLPGEGELVEEIDRLARAGELSWSAVKTLREWGRQSDFLRLYQAAYIGRLLERAGIKHVHAHFAGLAARTAYWIRQFYGIEYSLTVHANDIFAPRDFIINLRRLFESARAVVTVSDFAVAHLGARFPEEAPKFHRIYNGVELDRFRKAEFTKATPVILSIGRLIEKKGFSDLIAACGILKVRAQNFRCEIVGEGPQEQSLQEQIVQAGLQEFVQLIGPRAQDEIVEHLAAATLFVLPCRQDPSGDMDNLPTVIMEAMASGLPVVSTTIAGVPEMVAVGVSGELVPPNESAALAEGMGRILSDIGRAREYGARGREIAEDKFSLKKNVTALASLLVESQS
jgi:glycosyltransferase involved in cell wall biosynthesis